MALVCNTEGFRGSVPSSKKRFVEKDTDQSFEIPGESSDRSRRAGFFIRRVSTNRRAQGP